MIAGEMCVSECHADVLVPHQSLHRWQIDATHGQPTRKGIAQVIEGEIHHTHLAYCMRNAVRKDRYGVPVRVRSIGPSADILILTACNVAVNTSFIGTLRLSP